jgi:hypothetical protein
VSIDDNDFEAWQERAIDDLRVIADSIVRRKPADTRAFDDLRKRFEEGENKALLLAAQIARLGNYELPSWLPAPIRNVVSGGFTRGQKAAFDSLRERFESGDRTALIVAVSISCSGNCRVPDWAAPHIKRAADSWRYAEFRTLDEAFGVTRPKGFSIQAMRKKIKYLFVIECEISELLDREESLEVAIERVSEKHNFSESDVKRMYYEAKDLLKGG